MKAYRLTDANQPNALLKLAIQMDGAIDIFEIDFIRASLNGDVASYAFRAGSALFVCTPTFPITATPCAGS